MLKDGGSGPLSIFPQHNQKKARADNENVPAKCTALTERAKLIKPITPVLQCWNEIKKKKRE